MTDKIEKTVDIAAPVERVWRALTDHVEFGSLVRSRGSRAPFALGETSRAAISPTPAMNMLSVEATIIERMDAPTARSPSRWHPYAVEKGVDYSGRDRAPWSSSASSRSPPEPG